MQETKQSEVNVGVGIRALWPSCRQVSRLQSAATLQPLSLGQRIGLKFHLLVCSWCRRYGRQISFLRGAVQALREKVAESEPQFLANDARERLKKSLRLLHVSGKANGDEEN